MRRLLENLRTKFQEVNRKAVKIGKDTFFNVLVPHLKKQDKLYEFMGLIFDKELNLFIHTSSPKIWIGDDMYELPTKVHKKLLLKNLSKFVSDKEILGQYQFDLKTGVNDNFSQIISEPPMFMWGVKYEDIFTYKWLTEIPIDVLRFELKNNIPETFLGYLKVDQFLIPFSNNSSVLYIDEFEGFDRYRFKSFEDKYCLFQQMLEGNIRNIQNRFELIF
jgi:hypothetical protein